MDKTTTSNQKLKRSPKERHHKHSETIQNISAVTDVFLNQKRVNVCEHAKKMASLRVFERCTRGLGERKGCGNLKGNYLRLIPGLCLEDIYIYKGWGLSHGNYFFSQD